MTKECVDATNIQVKDFVKKYSEYPSYPIRIAYTFEQVNTEGELRPWRNDTTIVGYPGLCHHSDPKITEALLLFDGKGRLFPGVGDKDCNMKPKERPVDGS